MKFHASTVTFCLLAIAQASSTQEETLPSLNSSLILQERAGGTGSSSSGSRPGTGSSSGTRTGTGSRTVPKLPKAPIAAEREYTSEDNKRFSLGTYKADKQKVLFRNFEDPADTNYFAQIFTFFAAEASAETADSLQDTYQNARGDDNPFRNPAAQRIQDDNGDKLTGQALKFPRTYTDSDARTHLTISTFLPAATKSVCGAWSSLVDYCSDGGTDCACYSGTYYVPEMYNSLASKCASGFDTASICPDGVDDDDDDDDYWCSVQSHAAAQTEYCDSDVATTYKFAQRANRAASATATATGASAAGDDDDEDSMSDRASYDTTYTQAPRTHAPVPTLKPVSSTTEVVVPSSSSTEAPSTTASVASAVASSTAVSSASTVLCQVRAAGHSWVVLIAVLFSLAL